jgi:hypothetical protein
LLNPKAGWLYAFLYAMSAWLASASLEAADIIDLPTALAAALNASVRDPLNGMWLVLFIGSFIFFTDTHIRSWRILGGGFHAVMHLAAAFMVGWIALLITVQLFDMHYGALSQLLLSGLITFLLGGPAGTFILGVYLFVSIRVFKRHGNEAFSSLRICDYKQFVRLRISPDGKLTIFAIGIDRVPRRWRASARVNELTGKSEETQVAHDARATGPKIIDRKEIPP